MDEVGAIAETLERSLDDIEPAPFHSRVTAAAGERPLLPGVLTVRVAHRIDSTVDIQTAATRGAGVQLCYEGLELTRSVLRNRSWDGNDDEYQQDLLVAEVLVSRGFSLLAETGVVTDAVAIVQRFGRTQTNLEKLGGRHDDDPLEVDVLELAVNAGADLAMDGLSPMVRSHSGDIARELLDYPLPGPEAMGAVDDQLDALAAEARPTGTR
jgi:hypothetical protein